jgi:hypothetical protein
MTSKLPEDTVESFQEAGDRVGHFGGGQASLETMAPEEGREQATQATPATAETGRAGGTQQPAVIIRSQAKTRNPIASRSEALLLASQVLNGLGAYTCKGSRKRSQFYRRDLNWIADVLLRVDAGERNPLRPWGQ